MPEQYIQTQLRQIFDGTEFRKERGLDGHELVPLDHIAGGILGDISLGHSFGYGLSIGYFDRTELNGRVTFGPSLKALGKELRHVGPDPHYAPFISPTDSGYIAGSIIGNGNEVYIEAGSEDAPQGLRILLTPVVVQRGKGELVDVKPLFNDTIMLRHGDKVKLYDIGVVPETDDGKAYVAQFGNQVRYYKDLEGHLKESLCIVYPFLKDGIASRYNLAVERKIRFPELILTGLIPEGESTRVVTSEIYKNYELGSSDVTLAFRVTGEHRLIPQRVEELEKIARSSEASQNVPTSVVRGRDGETPEQLVGDFITRELYLPSVREAVNSGGVIPDAFRKTISINLKGS